jgi:hypothetical protein
VSGEAGSVRTAAGMAIFTVRIGLSTGHVVADHKPKIAREDAETVAESAAFVVLM